MATDWRRWMARTHPGVLVLMVGLVALYSWPLITDLAHLYPDNPDARVLTWAMLTAFRNLLTQPGHLLQGNAFYPVGQSLTFSEPLFTPALLAGPLHAATGNPVLAYNVTLIVFWALSGWAMYAVAVRLTRDPAAALMGAAIFTLCLYRTEMYIEFNMEMTFGIPLAIYALVRFLESQHVRDLAIFCLVFWLQAISVLYYAVILACGLAVIAVQYVALRWTGWRARTPLMAGAGGGALGLALAPVMWPFVVTRRELGFERSLSEVRERSAEVLTYLEPRSNWLYDARVAGYYYESSLFMGAVALGLAAVGLLWLRQERSRPRGWPERVLSAAVVIDLALAAVVMTIAGRGGRPPRSLSFTGIAVALFGLLLAREAVSGWRRRRTGLAERRLEPRDWIWLLLGLGLVAFLLSLGPVVHFVGHPVDHGLYAWLHPYLVPLRALRAANRIGVLVVFVVALLAAHGVTWLRAHLSRRAFGLAISLIGLLLALEYATFPLAYGRVTSLMRPVDHVLRDAPADTVVLEWPTFVPITDADAMFRSLGHGKRVVNGYSGFVPSLVSQLSKALSKAGPPFPTPAAEDYLRHIYPLDFLVLRLTDPALTPAWRETWEGLRRAPPPFLRFRGTYADEDLWQVTPRLERGMTAERWVSFGFLREHPVLRVVLHSVAADPTLEQSVYVRLNGRQLARWRLDGEATLSAVLSPPYFQAAVNVVSVDYRYRRPPSTLDETYRIGRTGVRSPGDLGVRSAGQPYGEAASITLNGVELATNLRGYNLVAFAPDGRVDATGAFDTFFDPAAAARLAAFVRGLPDGMFVAGAVRDEASGRLTEEAVAALRTLGVAGDLRGHFRESHAFVGVKGAAPGTALEELGPRAVTLSVGRLGETVGFALRSFALEPGAVRR